MSTVLASTLVADNYAKFGRYVNTTRACCTLDGLKAVQRRMLLAVRDEASSKFVRSSQVVGACLGRYHPHGETSSYDVLCRLVRNGFVDGHGSFGSYLPDDPAAAMRYTSVKAHSQFSTAVFRLIPYVPTYENEFGTQEPQFLPVPIPLALTTGSRGIGLGILSNLPAFSASSLFDALHADDPTKLRAPHNLNIVSMTHESLWDRGEGYVEYGMDVRQEYTNYDGKHVSIIEGNPLVWTPNLSSTFKNELLDESVYLRDESKTLFRIIISRVKNRRNITDEDVHTRAINAASHTEFYRCYVASDTQAMRIGLRSWLQQCWERYDGIVTEHKTQSIERLRHRIKVLDMIPHVAPLLQKGMSTEAIAHRLGQSVEIISEIEGKPLRMLRRSDFTAEISTLQKQIAQFGQLSTMTLGQEFVTSLETAQKHV